MSYNQYLYHFSDNSNFSRSFLPGKYFFECWGAQGGDSQIHKGGRGSYTAGIFEVRNFITLFFYLGQQGINNGGHTFNGGGKGSPISGGSSSGGGATDIRLISGLYGDFSSLKSRIMVAAGGGGSTDYYNSIVTSKGGVGGSLQGENGFFADHPTKEPNYLFNSTGGTQTHGGLGGVSNSSGSSGTNGTFGFGGYNPVNEYGAGGGGGYYGGGGGGVSYARVGTGAGGSSYISGHYGCNSISSMSTENNIIHTGSRFHYSGHHFSYTIMKSGLEEIPSPQYGTEIGHSGNGFVRISYLMNQDCSPIHSTQIEYYMIMLTFYLAILLNQ